MGDFLSVCDAVRGVDCDLCEEGEEHDHAPLTLWSRGGAPMFSHPRCLNVSHGEVCNDEIGSHFDHAWCHACGWSGSLTELRARAGCTVIAAGPAEVAS